MENPDDRVALHAGNFKMAGLNADVAVALQKLGENLGALAQAIEHQAAAIAALVEEVAAQTDEEPEDEGIPQAMSTKR